MVLLGINVLVSRVDALQITVQKGRILRQNHSVQASHTQDFNLYRSTVYLSLSVPPLPRLSFRPCLPSHPFHFSFPFHLPPLIQV